ncbi:hypothetical protein ACGFX2_37170 [Streptomyces goshikiensis]|uniref:hypothetical protein n=1 Tax=Streptomyces goshikiensis TaxID=1942 RepID=UPI00372180B0
MSIAYRDARERHAVFVTVEHIGSHWTVRLDRSTAVQHVIDKKAFGVIKAAIAHLVRAGEVRSDSFADTVHFVLYGVQTEHRARELGAAIYHALYGDYGPLSHAISA